MLQLLKHKTREHFYAARMRDAGLTAYGETPEKAAVKLTLMFASFVKAHGEKGQISSVFNRYRSPEPVEKPIEDNWEEAKDA